jgi:hypothetical protein
VGRYNLLTSTTAVLLLLVVAACLFLQNSYAVDSTQTTYCNKGKCSIGTSTLKTNSTLGIYSPGLYTGPNGVFIKNSQRIGIQLSQTCLIMEKNNITSNCLSYEKIKPFDTTNPFYAGLWIETPYYHRGPPKVLDAYKFQTGSFVVMVDPDPLFTTKARMIIVWDQNFTFVNPDDISKGGLVTVTHVNRFVSNCEFATVAPNLWLINDTIHYLESNCIKTHYNDTKITYHAEIPISYDNPYSSLKQQQMLQKYGITLGGGKHLMGGHTIKFDNCITKNCDIKDPYKKAKW